MSRRNSRKIAFAVLFQIDQVAAEPNEALDLYLEENEAKEDEAGFAREIVEGTLKHQEEIDMLIEKFSQKWTLDRMFSVDRVVLRIGCYEILYSPAEAPIAINEAVELSKIYGEDKSAGYINAILDKVKAYHEQQTAEAAGQTL